MNEGNEGNKQLMRYAGLAMQFLIAIGIGVFAGLKLDQWLSISFPMLVWLFPLIIICGMMVKIFKDTGTKK